MKKIHIFATAILLTGGMAVLTAPVNAEQGACGSMGSWEKFHELQSERMQDHQKRLHDVLKLTPDQESAWKQFVTAKQLLVRPESKEPAQGVRLTMPERAEKMLEFSKIRQERMAEHVAALKTFYVVLTPEQQKIFDDFHTSPRGRKHMGRPETSPAPSGSAKNRAE